MLFKQYSIADIQFVLTNGEPTADNKCSGCPATKSADQFKYYQPRVNADGYLMRSNTLCRNCEKTRYPAQPQIKFLRVVKDIPKPTGNQCPLCLRVWEGEWHRDHASRKGL